MVKVFDWITGNNWSYEENDERDMFTFLFVTTRITYVKEFTGRSKTNTILLRNKKHIFTIKLFLAFFFKFRQGLAFNFVCWICGLDKNPGDCTKRGVNAAFTEKSIWKYRI